ncbi:ATPase [Haloimpatiens sp. FM7315]|uniref:ATPase n=1 Tax=Haloimpatiens sp. FM7315 TaxID=3298609 RepID=UPI0035A2CBD9
MDVIELLEYLQDVLDNSPKFIVPGRVVVNKNEVMDIVERIINLMPDEFKKAKWICEEKNRILGEAQQEAEILKKEKMNLLKKEIERHSVTKEAQERAETIIASAQKNAKDLRLGAIDYADFVLNDLQDQINKYGNEMLNAVHSEVEKSLNNLSKQMEDTNKTIRENIMELRNIK